MTALTIESLPVISLSLSMPRNGAWFVDAQLSGEADLSGSIVLSDGTVDFSGAFVDGGPHAGRTFCRMVGGTGGLGSILDPRNYRSAGVGKILGDICSDAGESKSAAIDPGLSSQKLAYWTRAAGTGGTAVAQLAKQLDAHWRILPNGDVWIGETDYSIAPPRQFQVLDRDPIDRSYTIAIDDLSLWVGMTQDAGTISRIEYTTDNDQARATYWVD